MEERDKDKLTFCQRSGFRAKQEQAATNQQLPTTPWFRSWELMPSTNRWGSSLISCKGGSVTLCSYFMSIVFFSLCKSGLCFLVSHEENSEMDEDWKLNIWRVSPQASSTPLCQEVVCWRTETHSWQETLGHQTASCCPDSPSLGGSSAGFCIA